MAVTGVADGFLIGVALVILGVPGALPLAVITFFAAFIPIVGGIVGAIVAVPVTASLVAAVAAARKAGTTERLQIDVTDR